MKVVFTGGHHNSALVIAKEFIRRGHRVFWIGHRYTIIGDRQVSAEYREVTRAGILFYPVTAGKLQLRQDFFLHLFRIPLGFIRSLILLIKIKPDFIYSSGGYLAVPVCFIGWLFRIPIFTHEQAVVTGFANRSIAFIAKRIYTAFPDGYPYPASKMLHVGLPMRKEITQYHKYLFRNKRNTIYFTGGKQGSHLINKAVLQGLPTLLSKYNVIHQCGSNTVFNDYREAARLKGKMGDFADSYLLKDYFSLQEIGAVFQSADLVVGRAGAHTVYELLFLNKPGLLIPIPWAHNDEQTRNAKYYVKCGLGKILVQDKLSGETLISEIDMMLSERQKYRRNGIFTPPKDTVNLIIEDINKHLATSAIAKKNVDL